MNFSVTLINSETSQFLIMQNSDRAIFSAMVVGRNIVFTVLEELSMTSTDEVGGPNLHMRFVGSVNIFTLISDDNLVKKE